MTQHTSHKIYRSRSQLVSEYLKLYRLLFLNILRTYLKDWVLLLLHIDSIIWNIECYRMIKSGCKFLLYSSLFICNWLYSKVTVIQYLHSMFRNWSLRCRNRWYSSCCKPRPLGRWAHVRKVIHSILGDCQVLFRCFALQFSVLWF